MTGEGTQPITQDEAIARVVESAERMGVQLDEGEAAQWIAAMAAEVTGGDVVLDVGTGVYGHRVTMLDFKPEDLAHFRKVAAIVGLEDRPGVATALALSGSAAQSKIRPMPTSSSASTSRRRHAMKHVPYWPRSSATRRWPPSAAARIGCAR